MRRPTFRAYVVVAAACSLATTCTRRSEPGTEARATKAPVSADASAGALRRQEIAREKPALVAGALPVAAFVAEQLVLAPARGVTLVSVGASWCEPCQRFHRALAAGELDGGLAGFRFIEYDFDVAKDALVAAGYRPSLIPMFALPKSDGTASGRQIEGSVKGDGAVANILPRLLSLTDRPPP